MLRYGVIMTNQLLIAETEERFGDAVTQARLAAPAVRVMLGIATSWKLTNAEGAGLLGITRYKWSNLKSGQWTGVFNQDQLTRVALLLRINDALHELFPDDQADRWPRQVTQNPMLNGKSLVQAMVHGGIPFIIQTRNCLETAVARLKKLDAAARVSR